MDGNDLKKIVDKNEKEIRKLLDFIISNENESNALS